MFPNNNFQFLNNISRISTLFYPYVFLQKFLNNNFQFLNTCTKRALIFPTKLIVIWDYWMLLIFTNSILTIFHKLYPFLNGMNDVLQWT